MVLIQTGRTFAGRRPNRGEEEVAAFLNRLPADSYKAFREFSIDAQISERMQGFRKKRPDFIVVGPEVGIVVIEVKNWNVNRNQYRWIDQETVEIIAPGETPERADSPECQRAAYEQAVTEIVGKKFDVYVTGLLAFPTCARSDFFNKLSDPQALKLPGSKYLFDVSKVLFREDFEQFHSSPEQLLKRVVRADSRSRGCTPIQVTMAWNELLPQELRVGGMLDDAEWHHTFRCLSDEQIQWVLSQDESKNFLLDVAGSGKTNALVSKALHLLGNAPSGRLPRILMTTYSDNLAINIRRLFEQKLDPKCRQEYLSAVTIVSMPLLVANLVENFCGKEYRRPPEQFDLDYEVFCKEALEDEIEKGSQFPEFDWVLIDEVQDFDNFYLILLSQCAPEGKFFAVGDVAQRIYDRECDLKHLGILRDAALPKSYRMYRTPRNVAKLALRLLIADKNIVDELRRAKYELTQVDSKSPFPNLATMWPAADTVADLVQRILELRETGTMASDILVVSSGERLTKVVAALVAASIPVKNCEISRGEFVTVVDFERAKGLERNHVLICGVEDLPVRSSLSVLAKPEAERLKSESFSRRKLYVALTRTLQYATVVYEEANHMLVAELISGNAEIEKRRIARGA
jgi:hypothetical protein